MTEKTQHRSKGSKSGTGRKRVLGGPKLTNTGGYVIVKPRKTAATSIITQLATKGLFVAVEKGTKLSTIEKRLNSVAWKRHYEKAPSRPKERARLVGTALTRSESRGDLPWATDAQIESVIDMADTLSSDEIAERLHTNRETINQWRAAGRLIGVEGAKRGVRYPTAQLGENLAPLNGIKEVLEAMGSHWAAWRFLAEEINELGGKTGFDVLRAGGRKDLLDVIDARSYGSFS